MGIAPDKNKVLIALSGGVDSAAAAVLLRRAGVVGAVVPLISAIQTVEAIKILSGCSDKVNSSMVKYNFWENYYKQWICHKFGRMLRALAVMKKILSILSHK